MYWELKSSLHESGTACSWEHFVWAGLTPVALLCAQGCLCAARVGFLPHGMSRDELSVAVCQVCYFLSSSLSTLLHFFFCLFVCLICSLRYLSCTYIICYFIADFAKNVSQYFFVYLKHIWCSELPWCPNAIFFLKDYQAFLWQGWAVTSVDASDPRRILLWCNIPYDACVTWFSSSAQLQIPSDSSLQLCLIWGCEKGIGVLAQCYQFHLILLLVSSKYSLDT